LYFDDYIYSSDRKLYLEKKHFTAVRKSQNCRTGRLGVSIYSCKDCNENHIIYRSCKNRFCATCGVVDTYDWCERLVQQILPIKHHHIVTTLPTDLRTLRFGNENELYNILFKASAACIIEWFKLKHNIIPGVISVLHTSGSDLKYHPHIHMIVSSGGLDIQKKSIKSLKGDFLIEQRKLADIFKKHFLATLTKQFKLDKFKWNTAWTKTNYKKKIQKLNKKQWIVNIEPPLKDAQQIVGYVGRYTKRACLSEYKLNNIHDGFISFNFNDYKNTPRGEKPRISLRTYTNVEFLDRLLPHIPNKRFKSVRYYGAYTSHYKKHIPRNEIVLSHEKLELEHSWGEFESYRKKEKQRGKSDPLTCPHCDTKMESLGISYIRKLYYDDS